MSVDNRPGRIKQAVVRTGVTLGIGFFSGTADLQRPGPNQQTFHPDTGRSSVVHTNPQEQQTDVSNKPSKRAETNRDSNKNRKGRPSLNKTQSQTDRVPVNYNIPQKSPDGNNNGQTRVQQPSDTFTYKNEIGKQVSINGPQVIRKDRGNHQTEVDGVQLDNARTLVTLQNVVDGVGQNLRSVAPGIQEFPWLEGQAQAIVDGDLTFTDQELKTQITEVAEQFTESFVDRTRHMFDGADPEQLDRLSRLDRQGLQEAGVDNLVDPQKGGMNKKELRQTQKAAQQLSDAIVRTDGDEIDNETKEQILRAVNKLPKDKNGNYIPAAVSLLMVGGVAGLALSKRKDAKPYLLIFALAYAACSTSTDSSPTPTQEASPAIVEQTETPLAQPTQEALPTAAQPERPRTFFPEGISPWTQGMLSHYNQMDEIVVRPPGDSYRDNTIALLTAAFGYDAQGRHDPNAEVAEVGLGGAIGPLHRYEMDVITPNPDIPVNRFNRHQAVLRLVGSPAAGDPHPPGTLYFWTGASGLDPASMSVEEFRSAGFYVVTPPEGGRLETRFHDCVDGETGSSQQCTLVGIDADGNQVFHIDPETGHKLTPDPDNPDIVTVSTSDDSEDLGKFINGDQIPPALDGYSYQINNGEVALIDQQGNISHRLDESGEWVEIDDIGKLIVEANDLGKETIIVTDPNGFDVDIDVVPKHIVENASWDWAYRGFVRENNGTTQVYRTLQGVGENDRGRWFNIMSEMEVSGYGVVTIEYDSEEMIRGREANSVRGFGNIELVSPEHWRTVLETLWGNKQVVDFTEVEDLTQLRTHSLFGTETYLTTVPDNWINEKKINRGTGVSFVIRGDNPSHYSQAEFYNDEPTYTFQMAVNNNRPIVELYALYWEYNDQRLDDSNIFYKGIGVLDFMLHQTGLESIRAMLREDGNPWRSIPGNQPSPTHMRALRAVGAPDIIPQGWEVPLARVSSEDDRD